jgi:hypothetical protein
MFTCLVGQGPCSRTVQWPTDDEDQVEQGSSMNLLYPNARLSILYLSRNSYPGLESVAIQGRLQLRDG